MCVFKCACTREKEREREREREIICERMAEYDGKRGKRVGREVIRG